MFRALLCLALCGCPDDDPIVPDARPDAVEARCSNATAAGGTAELGTGTTSFEPLLTDQQLGLVTGPQGGYHFIVHSRIREMAPGDFMRPGLAENPVTLFSVFHADGRQIDKKYPPYHIGYQVDPLDPTLFALPSGRILQIENVEVPAIYSTRARVTLCVSDVEGRVATDERWVTVVPYAELADAGP